jgi:hypothetical protein
MLDMFLKSKGAVVASLNQEKIEAVTVAKYSCAKVFRHFVKKGDFPDYKIGEVNEIEFLMATSSVFCWCLSPSVKLVMLFHYENTVRFTSLIIISPLLLPLEPPMFLHSQQLELQELLQYF